MLHWRYFRFIQPFFWTFDSRRTSSWLRQDRYTNSWSEAANGTLWNENCQTLKSGKYSTAYSLNNMLKFWLSFMRLNSQRCCAKNCWELLRQCWKWCANGCDNSQLWWDLQCIMEGYNPKDFETMSNARALSQQWRPGPRVSLAPKTPFPFPFKRLPRRVMLEELCKRIQHCCATSRWSRNERDVGSCWFESLTGFKLCATTPTNRRNIKQCCVCMGLCNRA